MGKKGKEQLDHWVGKDKQRCEFCTWPSSIPIVNAIWFVSSFCKEDGSLLTFGLNDSGQLGHSSSPDDTMVPVGGPEMWTCKVWVSVVARMQGTSGPTQGIWRGKRMDRVIGA